MPTVLWFAFISLPQYIHKFN